MDEAIARFSTLPVQVEWKPFQIDPGTAVEGEDLEAYCRRRWGSSGWTNHLRREGKKDGANFGNWRFWPNTLKGHQFIQYGRDKHQISTNQLNSILFHALYEQGQNLSLTETLLTIARAHFPHWDMDDLRTYLEENKGAVQVQRAIVQGKRRYGVSAVPFFVIGGEAGEENGTGDEASSSRKPYGISGAQSAESLLEVFEQAAEDLE